MINFNICYLVIVATASAFVDVRVFQFHCVSLHESSVKYENQDLNTLGDEYFTLEKVFKIGPSKICKRYKEIWTA